MPRAFRLLIAGLMLLGAPLTAQAKLRVVTTLSTFADLAKTIGGDQVEVTSIASPQFNPHFIEPKPSDVLRVKRADLFVHAGLDLELWRWPLVDAAGNGKVRPGSEREVDLSRGIELLEVPPPGVTRAQGDIHLYGNPHYWLDPRNGEPMARTLAEKLVEIDPAHAGEYRQRLEAFVARLRPKIADWQARLRPYEGTELVGYHNEWPYLMRFGGLRTERFLEPKPGIPPTPQQIKRLAEEMRAKGIQLIIRSSVTPARAAESLAERTQARVLELCQGVGERPEAADYISLFDYNVSQLERALAARPDRSAAAAAH